MTDELIFRSWQSTSPPGASLAVLAVSTAVVVWSTWRRRRVAFGARSALLSMRLLVLALLAIMLWELSSLERRMEKPTLAVLVDASASMAIADVASDATRSAELSSARSRWSAVNDWLNQSERLRELANRFDVHAWAFSDGLRPLNYDAATKRWAMDDAPDGDESRLALAARSALNELRHAPPTALVIATDGRATLGPNERLSAAAEAARQAGVPIYVAGAGRVDADRDWRLSEAMVDELAFENDPVAVKATFTATGGAPDDATIELVDAAKSEVLASAPAHSGRSTTLTFTPKAAGELLLEVRVAALPDEADRANNAVRRTVQVRSGKIPVLLVDGRPRYEYRHLKLLLERERSIELKTVLLDADLEYAVEDRTALTRLPVAMDDWSKFAVVIWGDVNPQDANLESLRELVALRGRGLILSSGSQYLPSAYGGTPMEDLLPIVLSGGPSLSTLEPFRPQWTREGRRLSRVFQLADDPASHETVWAELPLLRWCVGGVRVKPGATTLLEHPRWPSPAQPGPVAALQSFGRGSVLWLATDEFWRWRFRRGDAAHGRFWIQTVRWMARQRSGVSGADLTTDRQEYALRDAVEFVATFEDPAAATTQVKLRVERDGGASQTLDLTVDRQTAGRWSAKLEGLAAGRHRAWMLEPALNPSPKVEFAVASTSEEMRRRSQDEADLRLAAERSHGAYFPLNQGEALWAALPDGEPQPLDLGRIDPLWNRPVLVWALALLMAATWLMELRIARGGAAIGEPRRPA